MAYKIFKEVVKVDLENGTVKVNILKLARDPPLALINIVERVSGADYFQKDEEEQSKDINN